MLNVRFTQTRLFALCQKEFRQILRDRQLLTWLILPPTFQLLIYGFALSPEVEHLRLGIADYSMTPISRELISSLVENHVFDVARVGFTEKAVVESVKLGYVEAGLIIPPNFARNIAQRRASPVQVVLDGVDANSAGIANGYLAQIINTFNRNLIQPVPVLPIRPRIKFLYNPGLISSWFFIPGVMGLVLNLTGSLVSSAAVIREKDSGTLEQLLMTPVDSWEILVAKILPLFVLLMADALLALLVGLAIFDVPFRGNLLLYLAITSLYVFVAIALGITLATISANQRQAILTSFFFNLPLIQLSGAIVPVESMPIVFQYLAYLNPLKYYVVCIRGILLKGVGIDVLWPDVLALAVFAVTFLWWSASRFRNQLR